MPKERSLKRERVTLRQTKEGYTVVHLPCIKGVVFSGGGAKGIAYAGLYQAFAEADTLENVEYVSGASAGAMTASIIAFGISPENLIKIVTKVNIFDLLTGGVLRSDGTRFRNFLELVYFLQLKDILENPNISKLIAGNEGYDFFIKKIRILFDELDTHFPELSIETLEKYCNPQGFSEIDRVMFNLDHDQKTKHFRISFGDLRRFRELLPDVYKHHIKNLSVVTTNSSKAQSETYNETITPDVSISEKVQHSGAHPVLFQPRFNEAGDYITDGGALDNMPSKPLEDLGLHPEEILCVKVEEDSVSVQKRADNAKSSLLEPPAGTFSRVKDHFFYCVLGACLDVARAEVKEREKVFFDLNNMLYLQSAGIRTTTISPSPEMIDKAISASYTDTLSMIRNRSKGKTFDHPLIALIYLGKKQLDSMMEDGEAFKLESGLAKGILFLQQELIKEMNGSEPDSSFEGLIEGIDNLIRNAIEFSKNKIDESKQENVRDNTLSLCLKQIDKCVCGKLGKYLTTHQKKFKDLLGLLNKPESIFMETIDDEDPDLLVLGPAVVK